MLTTQRQIWFSPQTLIDLAAIVVCAGENPTVIDKLISEYGVTLNQYEHIVDKLRMEVDKIK